MQNPMTMQLDAVTPLVVGGASGPAGPSEGIRVPSLRGGLRWWLRAGVGGVLSWDRLLVFERTVLGGGESGAVVNLWVTDDVTAKGRAWLRMNDAAPKTTTRRDGTATTVRPSREASVAGSRATLHAHFPSYVGGVTRECFGAALDLFVLLGGIGGRWRRGFGSLWPVGGKTWYEALAGETVDDRKTRLAQRIEADVLKIGAAVGAFAPEVMSSRPSREAGVRKLRSGLARVYLVEPDGGTWATWDAAMDALRTKYYRPLKGRLGVDVDRIGDITDRQPSPLVIQIKPATRGYVGVVSVFYSPRLEDSNGPWGVWDGVSSKAFPGLTIAEVSLP